MKRQTPLLLALALAAGPVRAETVEASSSTFLILGQQTRFRGGSTPDLVTVAPLYEILTVSARDINTGVTDDLRIVVSTWGALDLADKRWDNGTTSNLTGDVTSGYVQAKFAHRMVTVRLGREMVSTGIARMIQIDGGDAVLVVPVSALQLTVSGYAGAPTTQRFMSRGSIQSWSPTPGTLAYGGRVAVTYPIAGFSGRGLEVGASANMIQDHSDPVRQEVGGDFRLQPFASTNLALAGFATYSLYDARWAEANAALSVSPATRWHLTADYRFVEPSLLLARNSILSVFTASTWSEYGVGARYDLGRGLHAGLDLHLRSEPALDYGSHSIGSDVAGRLDWESGNAAAGAEVSNLDAVANGYTGARVYGRRDLGTKVVLTGDVLAQFFRKDVNGQREAVTGTVTAGYKLPYDFTALVAGSAGVTPYLEQEFSLMVKLAYQQTFRTQEVHQ